MTPSTEAAQSAVDKPETQPARPLSEAPDRPGERLHRWSWLFVMVASLVNLLPLILTVVVAGKIGRNDQFEVIASVVGAVGLSAYALFYTLTFRFWVETDQLIVTEGLFDRTLRYVPFARISNVSFKQSLLHRAFGVVEIRLESGAGMKPEATLTVLTLARAEALRTAIRPMRAPATLGLIDAAASAAHQAAATMIEPHDEVLVHQPSRMDLVKLGIISNKGMLVVGAAWLFMAQTGLLPRGMGKQLSAWVKVTFGMAHGWLFWITLALVILVVFLVLVRLVSVLYAINQFDDFKLLRQGDSWRSEHGLLTRRGGSSSAHKLVMLCLEDGWLYRWFNRQSLKVVVPGAIEIGQSSKVGGLSRLTPIAEPSVVQTLVSQAMSLQLDQLQVHPLHPNAWRRMVKWPLLFWFMALALLSLKLETAWPLSAFLLLAAWSVYRVRLDAKASGFALTANALVIHSGWFRHHTLIVPYRSIETVHMTHSGFDRRAQMAHVWVDLAAGPLAEVPKSTVRYLPFETALRLYNTLRLVSARAAGREHA